MENDKLISSIIAETGNTPDKLVEILLNVQVKAKDKFLSEDQLKIISKVLNIPLSKVYGVATFYSMLSTKKRGKYVIEICNSGPCYVKKSKDIAELFESLLDIKIGETTKDGLITLEYVSCFGACNIAPAVKINEKIYGNLDAEEVVKIITTLREEVL